MRPDNDKWQERRYGSTDDAAKDVPGFQPSCAGYRLTWAFPTPAGRRARRGPRFPPGWYGPGRWPWRPGFGGVGSWGFLAEGGDEAADGG